MPIDYDNATIYELINALRYGSDSKADNVLAIRTKSFKDLHWFRYTDLSICECPKTTCKINAIIKKEISDYSNLTIDWYLVNGISNILNNEVSSKIIDRYINSIGPYSWSIFYYVKNEEPINLDLLKYSLNQYKTHKMSAHYKNIQLSFQNLNPKDVSNASELLFDSTPLIQTLLLERDDIDEKYILPALRSQSRLKTKGNVKTKIKFDMLKRLTPKGRLEIVKHLTGFNKRYSYYSKYKVAEFERMPTKEELAEVLFACSMEYTQEVSEIVKYYDDNYVELLKQRKEKETQ